MIPALDTPPPASDAHALRRLNIDALLARGVDLRELADRPAPIDTAASLRFRAADSTAKAIAAAAKLGSTPLVVEGLNPPWLLLGLAETLKRNDDRYWRQIIVVQRDPAEFVAALGLADLRPAIAQDRITFLVGEDAGEQLRRFLVDRSDYALPQNTIASPLLRSPVTPAICGLLEAAVSSQSAQADRLRALVRARDAALSPRDRAARLAQATRPGATHPPRILIGTTRYSTFVKHSAADLAAALSARGCNVHTLIEPDDHTRLASTGWLRAFADFDPDLAIVINYPRSTLPQIAPPSVPWVCWIQDAPPHFFDKQHAAAVGPCDFLAGHFFPELANRAGYPKPRTLPTPVLACARKFHPGPVAPALAAAHRCDVSFVTHHSEPPQAMHRRLVSLTAWNPPLQRALEPLLTPIIQAVADASHTPLYLRLREIAHAAATQASGNATPARDHDLTLRQFVLPIADRVMRFQALEWLVAVCSRRNWSFHLHGRGWDTHPTYSRFAKGELAHGEELRAAYHGAAASVHVSPTTLTHQRVLECALSGGFPLVRWHDDGLSPATTRALAAAVHRGANFREPDRDGFRISAHPELAEVYHARATMGFTLPEILWIPHSKLANNAAQGIPPEHESPLWLMGQPAELGFWDEKSLETRLARAIEDPAWRREQSALIAARVRDTLTYDAFAARMLDWVRHGLAPTAALAA